MAVSLRGQLGVKSSPLSPTSSKLTTQMLVISHMDNHYRKISKAKPAIDNAPPKSMVSSQKLRDRQVRKHVEKYGSRPTSRATYRPGSAQDIYDEQQWEEAADEEERQVRDIMRTALRVPLRSERGLDSVDATAGTQSESARFGTTTLRPRSAATARGVWPSGPARPGSARSMTSVASQGSRTSRGTHPLKVTYDGDVLTKHARSFTQPAQPFTPRTLKSNRESSLKRYKYYTPPPTKAGRGEEAAVEDRREAPQAKPRRKPSREARDLGQTDTLTETMLMDMSLQSHPAQHPLPGESSQVPRLDISMDKDHLHWMQEQATRAQVRARNSTATPHPHPAASDGGDTLAQSGTLGQTDTLRFTRTATSAKSFGIKSPTSHRLSQAEEEQKYVNFAHEVTQDIVSRSISSDRVLQKVFENHIERKKGELDERRLRAIITDIRRDLGVQHVEPLDPSERRTVQDRDDLGVDPSERRTVQHSDDLGASTTLQGETTMTLTTMDSQDSMDMTTSTANNTYNFERTTDMLSTIHSQQDDNDDLSATAALTQYQMTLTVQADAEEDNSVTSEGLDHTLTTEQAAALGSTLANGDAESADSVHSGRQREAQEHHPPSPRPRTLPRHRAPTTAQHTLSRQTSATDTDARTDNEEEEEEEYEDDYDADEDDNHDRGSEDEF